MKELVLHNVNSANARIEILTSFRSRLNWILFCRRRYSKKSNNSDESWSIHEESWISYDLLSRTWDTRSSCDMWELKPATPLIMSKMRRPMACKSRDGRSGTALRSQTTDSSTRPKSLLVSNLGLQISGTCVVACSRDNKQGWEQTQQDWSTSGNANCVRSNVSVFQIMFDKIPDGIK